MINLYNIDCLEYMANCKDKQFDLAICDPPYGVEEITGKEFSHGRGKLKNRVFNKANEKINKWDKAPKQEYFIELFRISKNQIIWGGNYFDLPKYRCPIAWDKCQPWENFSQIELAWTSFNMPASLIRIDNRTSGKQHPTEKPIKLYKWLLGKYAKAGDKILDTHLGSGSSLIAAYDMGFSFTGCELDTEYFDAMIKRFNVHTSQLNFFNNNVDINIDIHYNKDKK
jgi:site-specific DNA-methyltransferase (adenine-specific)